MSYIILLVINLIILFLFIKANKILKSAGDYEFEIRLKAKNVKSITIFFFLSEINFFFLNLFFKKNLEQFSLIGRMLLSEMALFLGLFLAFVLFFIFRDIFLFLKGIVDIIQYKKRS